MIKLNGKRTIQRILKTLNKQEQVQVWVRPGDLAREHGKMMVFALKKLISPVGRSCGAVEISCLVPEHTVKGLRHLYLPPYFN